MNKEEIVKQAALYLKESTDNESTYCNYDTCRKCRGSCCKSMPCHVSPKDLNFDITEKNMINLFNNSNLFSLDWWNGDPTKYDENSDECKHTENSDYFRGFYVRIRQKDRNTVIDPSIGGACSLLNNTCSLPFNLRPEGARKLIPACNEGDECDIQYSKQECAIEWLQYHDIMQKVFEYFVEKEEYNEQAYMLSNFILSIFEHGGCMSEEESSMLKDLVDELKGGGKE